MRRLALILTSMLLLFALSAAPAAADQAYHTERLQLDAVDGASGTGMVVNIHPNGPQVYALERYALRNAEASKTYQVWLLLYLGNLSCDGDPALALPTAEVGTNTNGNGLTQFLIRPEDVAPLRGMTISVRWQLTLDDVLTHETRCTVVTLD